MLCLCVIEATSVESHIRLQRLLSEGEQPTMGNIMIKGHEVGITRTKLFEKRDQTEDLYTQLHRFRAWLGTVD